MYLDNLFGAGSYLSPSQWGSLPSANANALNGANATNTSPVISSKAPTPVGAAKLNSDQVSLSNAAQALQAQSGTSTDTQSGATTDFSQEQQMLTTLTDKSLAALGIISPADEANTQITFDALSYQVSSSATASVGQQGSQSSAGIGASQDATFTGVGHIVTPDGTQYTFQVSLELDQSEQATSTSDSGSGDVGANNNVVGNNNAGNVDSAAQQPNNLLAQLVNAIGLPPASSSSSATGSSNPLGNSSVGNANGSAQVGQSGPSTSSSSGINWDAILKQTSSLFDLLDALVVPKATSDQTAAQTSGQVSNQPSASTPTQASGQTLATT